MPLADFAIRNQKMKLISALHRSHVQATHVTCELQQIWSLFSHVIIHWVMLQIYFLRWQKPPFTRVTSSSHSCRPAAHVVQPFLPSATQGWKSLELSWRSSKKRGNQWNGLLGIILKETIQKPRRSQINEMISLANSIGLYIPGGLYTPSDFYTPSSFYTPLGLYTIHLVCKHYHVLTQGHRIINAWPP